MGVSDSDWELFKEDLKLEEETMRKILSALLEGKKAVLECLEDEKKVRASINGEERPDIIEIIPKKKNPYAVYVSILTGISSTLRGYYLIYIIDKYNPENPLKAIDRKTVIEETEDGRPTVAYVIFKEDEKEKEKWKLYEEYNSETAILFPPPPDLKKYLE